MTHTLTLMPALENKRILIVEDTLENMRLFRALLNLEGAVVLEADNARAGILSAQEQQPDLILMDIQLPDVDGFELMRRVKADPVWDSVPMIAVTAMAMPGDCEKCLEAGASAYLSKPLDLNLTIATVRSFLT